MKRRLAPAVAIVTLSLVAGYTMLAQTQASIGVPQFGADNELMRPQDYREWIYLSSGLGMSYNPSANPAGNPNPPFDNVYVAPAAYRSFLQTGTWPDKTMFVLELRASTSEGSILRGGRFQGQLLGLEVEVKDESRFPGKWGFYEFGRSAASVKPLPTTASCYSCHAEHGAVDNTFVQFYPTLADIARQKGTFKTAP
jgi:hypothetical protein